MFSSSSQHSFFSGKKLAAGLLAIASLAVTTTLAADRGLAWGANDAWAPTIASKALITWAHHWEMGAISTLPSKVEFVPMNWGPKYRSLWSQRVAQMNCSLPSSMLAYNEPDVSSQSNMTPLQAAVAYVSELQPYRDQGVQVSSPQIAWNLTWMDAFLTELRSRGSDVDFIALHYYGSYNSLSSFESYVNKAWTKYKLPIWITELGTTNGGGGSNAQTRDFMSNALAFLDSKSYVKRVAWTGNYAVTQPPDNYINKFTSFFFADGSLRQIGQLFACGQIPC